MEARGMSQLVSRTRGSQNPFPYSFTHGHTRLGVDDSQ
ncbi:unnamed protein product, partial [Linum tenue]